MSIVIVPETLAAHGFEDFTRTEVPFAGEPEVVLEFVSRNGEGTKCDVGGAPR